MQEFYDSKTETQSVAEFLSGINSTLARHSGRVEGEVTSVKDTYPTAVYFSIKDTTQDALLSCVIWKSIYVQNGVRIKEGDKIIVTGTPEIYAARGSFSMKVNTIEYAGEGQLKKAYDELKIKLEADGLLATERKRPLALYPRRIGVITSRSGVVIQDFNSNLGRYGFQITMVDSRVEGKDAIHELLAALKTMRKQDIEVLVIMRGGGSWESLQPFNTESVVRAIASFHCPVLTGIGHDVDVTLAELVADRGASTPTAVAEALNETWDTLQSSLEQAEVKIMNSLQQRLSEVGSTIDSRQARLLRQYDAIISNARLKLTGTTRAIEHAYRTIETIITKANLSFQNVVTILQAEMKSVQRGLKQSESLIRRKLRLVLKESHSELLGTGRYIAAEQRRIIATAGQRLTQSEQAIKIADPARTLRLGYSLSYVGGKIIRSTADVHEGSTVEVRVHDGSFTTEVKKVQ
ncbi:MAG: exodeoxyribonuclease VII large subunit [Patescibacteria group bacterium]